MNLNPHSPGWGHIDGAQFCLDLDSLNRTEKISHCVLAFLTDQLIIITSYRPMAWSKA